MNVIVEFVHKLKMNKKQGTYKILRVIFLVAFLAANGLPVQTSQAETADIPNLLSPADGVTVSATGYGSSLAAPPAALPQFSWSAVPGATRYRIQFSPNIGFSPFFEFTTPHTKFIPTNVAQFADGDWYWRVRVDAPMVDQYSQPRLFIREWASPDNKPTLTAPTNGESLQFFTEDDFSWLPVVGASSYRFQISTDPGFTTLTHNIVTLATTYQPPLKFANGTYYWRVIPLNPANREGTYSDVWQFEMNYNQIPTQLEPLDDSFPTFTPTFRWTAVIGAQYYRLEYSTDPSFVTGTTVVFTRNTSYTPTSTLPNDVNYYWRVRTHSGNSVSGWSSTWSFIKKWYIQPLGLTPTNNYQQARFPFFSWTPVPGAKEYEIQVDDEIDFSFNSAPNPLCETRSARTDNPFFEPRSYCGADVTLYWRVRPFDGSNREGVWSQPFSYRSSYTNKAPQQVYPFYYYSPNNLPAPDEDVEMQPHIDQTVPYPVFTWLRVTEPYPVGGPAAEAYRIEVSPTSFPWSPVWSADTETMNAAPLNSDAWRPVANQDYYWRVCPLNAARTSCLTNTSAQPYWSQVWRARFDPSVGLSPRPAAAVQLLRPVRGAEFVEYSPVFEWYPKQGATAYDIEISRDPTFTSNVISGRSPYPVFSPRGALADRFIGELDYGTYYWRVRARNTGGSFGSYSQIWHFQIASQSGWKFTRSLGAVANQLQIGSDPDDVADNFELTTLNAAQDKDYWYFGFNALAAGGDMTYVLYLDQDHEDDSGATFDAAGYHLSAIPAHQPEYAVYILQEGGGFSADNVGIYQWNGTSWSQPVILSNVGGAINYSANYLEIQFENTSIGMGPEQGSYAVMLTSVNSTGNVIDSVPQDPLNADPNNAANIRVERFTSVSDKPNLVYPRNNLEVDLASVNFDQPNAEAALLSIFPMAQPLYWEFPVGANSVTPWGGAVSEVHLDEAFTSRQEEYTLQSNATYYASTAFYLENDIKGDNTYFWRHRIRYCETCPNPAVFSAWSNGTRFERQGFKAENLQVSWTFATPTFKWDIVEGARDYRLIVDNDPSFSTPAVNIVTTQTEYTPVSTLPNGVYHWKVIVNRDGNGISSDESIANPFTLDLPSPTGLNPDDPAVEHVVRAAPTLCWDNVFEPAGNEPVLTAYKYRVEVSQGDPTFSQLFDVVETENRCWTPTKGYPDGEFFWRVAMIDGDNRRGSFSVPAAFTKQYRVTTLVTPTRGTQLNTDAPVFVWTVVNGAAAYRVEIATNSNFSPLFDSATTNNVRFTPVKVYSQTDVYYWRVAIIDANGRMGPFTDEIILDPNDIYEKVYIPIIRR